MFTGNQPANSGQLFLEPNSRGSEVYVHSVRETLHKNKNNSYFFWTMYSSKMYILEDGITILVLLVELVY